MSRVRPIAHRPPSARRRSGSQPIKSALKDEVGRSSQRDSTGAPPAAAAEGEPKRVQISEQISDEQIAAGPSTADPAAELKRVQISEGVEIG